MAIAPDTLDTTSDLPQVKTLNKPQAALKVERIHRVESTYLADDDPDERSFFQRYRLAVALVVVMLTIAAVAIKMASSKGSAPRRQLSLVVVSLPPPPPPPPQQAPPEPKMVEQQTFEREEKPQEEPPKPPDQPPIGTNIKGDGRADSFGLSGSTGDGFSSSGTVGTRFGWYAGQVQSKVEEALRNNRKTRSAEMTVQVRIWPDTTGRITRAQLAGSTGDPSVDAALKSEVLTGLQLREPPPAEMPMPIVLRLTVRRSK